MPHALLSVRHGGGTRLAHVALGGRRKLHLHHLAQAARLTGRPEATVRCSLPVPWRSQAGSPMAFVTGVQPPTGSLENEGKKSDCPMSPCLSSPRVPSLHSDCPSSCRPPGHTVTPWAERVALLVCPQPGPVGATTRPQAFGSADRPVELCSWCYHGKRVPCSAPGGGTSWRQEEALPQAPPGGSTPPGLLCPAAAI